MMNKLRQILPIDIYIDRYARFVSFMNGKNQNKDIFHLIKRDN